MRNSSRLLVTCVLSFVSIISAGLSFGASNGALLQTEKDLQVLDIAEGSGQRFDFDIENVGNETLHISSLSKNCSCVDAEVIPNDLSPGSAGILSVWYIGEPGKDIYSLMVVVKCNAVNSPSKVFRMKGNIFKSDIVFAPNIAKLECVETDQATSFTIACRDREDRNVRIDNISVSDKRITYVGNRQEDKVRMLRFRCANRQEPFNGNIEFDISNGEEDRHVTIPVRLSILPEYSIIPPEIRLHRGDVPIEYEKRIMIRANGTDGTVVLQERVLMHQIEGVSIASRQETQDVGYLYLKLERSFFEKETKENVEIEFMVNGILRKTQIPIAYY